MMAQPDTVYVFDLDGVITDPADSQVNEKVVGAMDKLLAAGTCLAVNTGRSFEWVEQNLIGRLGVNREDAFRRFVAICEKGGEKVVRKPGHWSVTPSQFALPQESYEITRALFDHDKEQLQSMFWDNTKRTMATIEKVPSANLTDFHMEQRLLVEKLSSGLADREAKIDATTIATDVESPLAGKRAGAQLIYQWVQPFVDIADSTFISIGDSASDYEMARYFAEEGVRSIFVYVGEPTDKIVCDARVTFLPTKAHYASGALEFLSK